MTLVVTICWSSLAQARPDARKFSCAAAQKMVRDNGQVVFTTGPNTYSMFVSNRRYCDPWQVLSWQYAPTKDNPKCRVAYKCDEPIFDRPRFGLF
ncbi:MAG: hypothetical protein HWE23_07810 [Rhodobacteraceae bacterium]|nr:hypothetical protein [Paracoccaceae bacterium]